MPVPDEKRNKQFKKDVEAGLSITELAKKYRLSVRQVSRLKKKLREEQRFLQLSKQSGSSFSLPIT